MAELKPRPALDPDSTPFWQACREHRLIVQRCTQCGRTRFPPGPTCATCGAPDHDWIDASGRGRVFSWIVVRHPVPADVYAGEVPYVVALIELEEGVRLVSNVIGCAPEAVAVDMPVEVMFDDRAGEVPLPKFRPISAP